MVVVFALAIALTACQPTLSPSPSGSTRPAAGGTLRVGVVHWAENYSVGTAPGPVFDIGLDPAGLQGDQSGWGRRICPNQGQLIVPLTCSGPGRGAPGVWPGDNSVSIWTEW